jgi:pimeloyl-ACP methyl ester carboxylesterase
MIMIEECGHWTQTEKPQELNTAIIGWMQKHAF